MIKDIADIGDDILDDMVNKSMYWDINKTLSHNCLINFVIGGRGSGKTYGAKEYVIKKFKKTREQFIYLRRYKTELKTMNTFFDDIRKDFPDTTFEVKGNKFLIDGEIAGWCYALSTAKILKSTSFPNVSTIVFDEYILDKGAYRYLPDEVVNFLEFYETVARSRNNVRAILISNAITQTNPYFSYFKISLPRNTYVKKFMGGDILLELVDSREFQEHKKATRFGKIIAGTQYGDYNIENTFLRDNDKFVAKLPKNVHQYFVVKYEGKSYGVYVNLHTQMMYFSYKHNPNTQVMSFTTEDHEENTFLMRSNDILTKSMREHFKYAMVRFESIQVKNELLPLLEKIA